MSRPFVIVVADDWGFRSCCRESLVAAGYRVASPTTKDAAAYFLASAYPPDVVVVSARERWEQALREPMRRAVRRIALAVVDRCPDARFGGTRPLENAVRDALEQLATEPVAWRDDLALGVDVIDGAHRAQFALLDALEGVIRAGRREEGLERFRDLQTLTERHFSDEQALMRLHGIDGEEHAGEHARLLSELGEMASRCAGGDPTEAGRLILSLRDWLEGHIRTMDRTLAERVARRAAARNDT